MTTATMRRRKTEAGKRAAVEVIQPPVPTAAECGVCFWCGEQFQPCDLPKDAGKDWYGCRKVEFEGRQGTVTERNRYGSYVSKPATVHEHDRLDVPFCHGLHVCRGCLELSRQSQNKVAGGAYVHPSCRAADAAFAKRVREMGERVGGFYNPRTYNHPSVRKWDAAVKSGKIKLDLRCRFELLPGNSKLGKGIGKIGTVTVETMNEQRAAEFKAEMERRKAAQEAREQSERDRQEANRQYAIRVATAAA